MYFNNLLLVKIMNFSDFFTKIWFTKQEGDIFLTLYKLGSVPASTVAKHTRKERTWVYKTLLEMTKKWVVNQTKKQWVTQFRIPWPHVLRRHLEEKQSQLALLSDSLEDVELELENHGKQRYPHLPKISLYDGIDWVKSLFGDIYQNVIDNHYLVIKFFASNTFESQTVVHTTLKEYYQNIFQKLKKEKVTIDTYLGNGVLIMEQVSRTTNIDNLSDLPAWNSAVNIFVVWKTIYLVIFKDIPFGIKIDSEEVANTMHFLFEKLHIS